MVQTTAQYYPLGGGLDVVTPALSIPGGRLIGCVNYEPWYNDGYRRIDGYERYDGRPRPHLQTFTGFDVDDATGFAVGDTVTGGTSSTTGVIIGIDGNSIGVTKVSGSGFINGETLTSSGTGTAFLFPDANATDADSALVTNDFTRVDEGISAADGAVNDTVTNEFPNSGAAQVIWTLADLPASAGAITEWIIRARARVVGTVVDAADTFTYRVQVTINSQSQSVTFTESDLGIGFQTRAATQASPTGTNTQVDAATVVLEQTAWTQNGGADNPALEVDCFELEVDYTPTTTLTTAAVLGQAPTTDLEDEWLLAAQDDYRDDIAVVPGTGEVRGVWRRKDDTYAWRNNVGNTAGIMHTDSASGWVTTGITLTDYVKFDAGGGGASNALPVEGDTVTGATSGASGTVHRVINWAGSVGSNDATGYLVLTGVTGGPFTDGEKLQVSATDRADANGASQTFAFSIDGTYRFHNHNFFATTGEFNVYGVNGEDDAFEIDEAGVVSPILIPTVADLTGITENNDPPAGKPFLIEEHRNHLFLAFPDGRVVHSVVGEPLNFSAFLNAAEFGLGDEVTGLNSVVGGVLIMTTERETRGLFGNNITDWEMRLVGEQTGGRLYSTQKLDTVYALDDLGITSVARTETFGDFVGATVSQLVQPIILALRELVNDSVVRRASNQYRLYFSDNSCLIMFVTQPGSINESRGTQTAMGVQFGFAAYPIEFKRIYNSEDETGLERTFFASTDGFVYEDGVGANFDGTAIASYVRTAFTHLGTPSFRKKFRRLDLEINAAKPLNLKIVSDLSYSAAEISSGITDITSMDIPVIDIFAGGGFWDTDNWDEFFWDGQNISNARAQLRGTGENISFLIFNESATARPFILQGLTVQYDKRRLQR